MSDRFHGLPVTRQAMVLGISRGSVYYQPRQVSADDLAIMRRIDELHLDFPFAGSRMLRDLLHAEGIEVGWQHVATLMKRMGIEATVRIGSVSDLKFPLFRCVGESFESLWKLDKCRSRRFQKVGSSRHNCDAIRADVCYKGIPHSAAGRFVVDFFEMCDPELHAQSISSAMAEVISLCRIVKSAGGLSNRLSTPFLQNTVSLGNPSVSCRRMDVEKLPQLRANGYAVSRDLNPRLVRIASCKPLGRFRLERLPGGTCTHWKPPPFHGAHP